MNKIDWFKGLGKGALVITGVLFAAAPAAAQVACGPSAYLPANTTAYAQQPIGCPLYSTGQWAWNGNAWQWCAASNTPPLAGTAALSGYYGFGANTAPQSVASVAYGAPIAPAYSGYYTTPSYSGYYTTPSYSGYYGAPAYSGYYAPGSITGNAFGDLLVGFAANALMPQPTYAAYGVGYGYPSGSTAYGYGQPYAGNTYYRNVYTRNVYTHNAYPNRRIVTTQVHVQRDAHNRVVIDNGSKANRDRIARERNAVEANRDRIANQRNTVEADRDRIARERNAAEADRDRIARERNTAEANRDRIANQRNTVEANRDRIDNQRSTIEANRDRIQAQDRRKPPHR